MGHRRQWFQRDRYGDRNGVACEVDVLHGQCNERTAIGLPIGGKLHEVYNHTFVIRNSS